MLSALNGCYSSYIVCPLVLLDTLGLLLDGIRFMFGYENDGLCNVHIGCSLV